MGKRNYQTSIPVNAVEVVEEWYPGGERKKARYLVGEEVVGRKYWDEEGWLEFETPLRNEVRHGREYRFYPSGQVLDVESYRNGKLHGVCREWAEDGTLLITSRMKDGCGLSLWCDNQTGTLAEEHYWPGEAELGYSRQWNGDEKTVYEEYFYVMGKGDHGVRREWNTRGRLRRGFPQFFVSGQKVTRRQYLLACRSEPTLPPYRPEDDNPHRELPAEYLAQRKKRTS